jgi:hypothetical protein
MEGSASTGIGSTAIAAIGSGPATGEAEPGLDRRSGRTSRSPCSLAEPAVRLSAGRGHELAAVGDPPSALHGVPLSSRKPTVQQLQMRSTRLIRSTRTPTSPGQPTNPAEPRRAPRDMGSHRMGREPSWPVGAHDGRPSRSLIPQEAQAGVSVVVADRRRDWPVREHFYLSEIDAVPTIAQAEPVTSSRERMRSPVRVRDARTRAR